MTLLLHLNEVDEALWARRFGEVLGGYKVARRGDAFDPGQVRYIFVWKPAADAFEGLDRLKAVLSLGAGVDALLTHEKLPAGVPIVRFVDAELSQCMSDYTVAQVTMHHRHYVRYRADQAARRWSQFYPPAAWRRSVGIMGLGEIGRGTALRLKALGFKLRGWSRGPKAIDGVEMFSGPDEFDAFLGGTDILVNLLPLTPETAGILNYETFGKLRRTRDFSPVIINAARGGHQVEQDIVRALADGTLGAASLDVFETEPLPETSPLWGIKTCFITPHIAAISTPQTGVNYFARVLLDHEAGKPLPNVVDVARGY